MKNVVTEVEPIKAHVHQDSESAVHVSKTWFNFVEKNKFVFFFSFQSLWDVEIQLPKIILTLNNPVSHLYPPIHANTTFAHASQIFAVLDTTLVHLKLQVLQLRL